MVDSLRYEPDKADPPEALSIRVAGKVGRSLRYTVWHRRPNTTCVVGLVIIRFCQQRSTGTCSAVP
jgi:hypothetical protein